MSRSRSRLSSRAGLVGGHGGAEFERGFMQISGGEWGPGRLRSLTCGAARGLVFTRSPPGFVMVRLFRENSLHL